MALIAKALAHPARVAIIQHLLKVDQCICGEIVNEISLAQPTISRHLNELKSIGIIKGTIEGTSISYCIDAKKWRIIQQSFNSLFDTYILDRDCC